MGNYIKTKSGVDISLAIPAQITSFETSEVENSNSHVTRGKLKVFSIGKTGDYRVFTREFAESLVASLPGTPVVAYYDDEADDFIGHNDEQYVYGYVPEDAVPEFIEENNKTWAVVEVNLFTERQDKIGEIANKIIGKAQSLELNPDTVDWELVYINNKLEKIVFKKGSFYGLSVLGDNQTPAFQGAGFFTSDVIEQLKSFQTPLNQSGGNLEMNKTDFLSLGISGKRQQFDHLINEKQLFDAFYVVDFDEENIYIEVWKEQTGFNYLAAPYTWEGEDNYTIGEFYEVIPSFVRKENESSNPSEFEASESTTEESTEPVIETEVQEFAAEESKPVEEKAVETESENFEQEESDSDEQANDETNNDGEENSNLEKEKTQKNCGCQEISTDVAALSNEERSELEQLRREKKLSLISNYEQFLSEEVIEKFKADIDSYDLLALEKELKIQSFDANKQKIKEKEGGSFGIVLPNISEKVNNTTLDCLVAENIKR